MVPPRPGAASPVVLLPGTGLTAGDWEPVAAELSRTRVVHAVDLRGHGASDWPGSYSIDLLAGDVARLLPQLGPRVEQVRPEVDTPSQRWPGVLRSLTVPVLALSGGPASFVPVEWVEDLVAGVADGAMVTVDAGHEVHRNRPADFLDAVLGFLPPSDATGPATSPVSPRRAPGTGGSRR